MVFRCLAAGTAALAMACAGLAQSGPPAISGFFPLSEVKAGLKATAWTVFEGSAPEPMDVEILGVLRGGRGPGHDMILARLHGPKPDFTGVVAGMSGSPVYVGDKLMGSLSYRIGQFSKEPIAGITPIEQMLEVRDISTERAGMSLPSLATNPTEMNMQAMETPLVMSGFLPEAVKLWQDRMKGTGLDVVAAGGMGASSGDSDMPSAVAAAKIVPGSAVSAQLVRGDVEISATCTVTYVDPKQLLACGHPLQQSGAISLPMTATEVVATLPSPLNSFKIVNTGAVIGAFTEDRDSAIRGVFGAQARMIPVHVTVHRGVKTRTVNFEVLDLPALTAQAVLVGVYNSLLQSNEYGSETSYHVTGSVALDGTGSAPVEAWASGGDGVPAAQAAALGAAEDFNRFYANSNRIGQVRDVRLDVEEIPRRITVELSGARIVSSNIVHAGDTVTIEATVRPYQQPLRNVRIPVTLPARLQPGPLRVLVSDAETLDRTLNQPRLAAKAESMDAALAAAKAQHTADRLYVSLLMPEAQAGVEGTTLATLPLSMANALESLRAGQEATLNGESALVATDAPAGGMLNGYQVLTLDVEPGGGVN